MRIEQLFLLVIVVVVVTVITTTQVSKYRNRIKRVILDRLNISRKARQRKSRVPEKSFTESEAKVPVTEEEAKAELKRLQKLIEDRKQVARDTDISYHLWGLYKNLLRYTNPHSMDNYTQDGEWYDLNILQDSTQNGLKIIEIELKGARYKFINDEENQGWGDNIKYFSLFLHDDSNRCLIEIPMRVKVDRWGNHYSILTGGPKAFLPGDWINELVNVKLKHQSMRNQGIRAQKHQERLSEIEELKKKFGISD